MRDQDRALFQGPWATQGHALSPGSKANEASSRMWSPRARTGAHNKPQDAPSAENSVTPHVHLSRHYQSPTLVSTGHLPRTPNCTWHDGLHELPICGQLFPPAKKASRRTASTAPPVLPTGQAEAVHLPAQVMCRCKTHTHGYLD